MPIDSRQIPAAANAALDAVENAKSDGHAYDTMFADSAASEMLAKRMHNVIVVFVFC